MATQQIHVRSISLPTRLNSTSFEAQLQKLKSFPLLSSEAIQSGLLGLLELYISVDELTRSSSQHQDAKSMEDQLEGSIELLDSCSTIRELFQMIKESVQTLQSALRRKGLDSSIQSDVATYACSRKRMNKCINKTLRTLKALEQKNNVSNNNGDHSNLISVLTEVSGLTTTIFKGILGFVSCTTTKTGGWNLVSKLMVTKSSVGSDRGSGVANEAGCVDFALNSLQVKMRRNCVEDLDLQMVQKGLQNLESMIEGFEGGLERLFRQLVQTRVALLNILTDH